MKDESVSKKILFALIFLHLMLYVASYYTLNPLYIKKAVPIEKVVGILAYHIEIVPGEPSYNWLEERYYTDRRSIEAIYGVLGDLPLRKKLYNIVHAIFFPNHSYRAEGGTRKNIVFYIDYRKEDGGLTNRKFEIADGSTFNGRMPYEIRFEYQQYYLDFFGRDSQKRLYEALEEFISQNPGDTLEPLATGADEQLL